MARKSKELENIIDMLNSDEIINEDQIEELKLDAKFIYELKENVIYIIDDKRDEIYLLHSIESIILTVIFALIANCNTFVQIHLFLCKHYEWLSQHIRFENGIPSISTIKRVIAFINPKQLEQLCVKTVRNFLIDNQKNYYEDNDIIVEDINSMDGKTANSSNRKSSKNGEIKKTNAMSLYSLKHDICEATEFISEKTNEIPTGPVLLKNVNIKNCIITFDAMSTQTDTTDYIFNQHGYYVAPVKGNQSTLEENIRQYFGDKKLLEKAKEENYYVVKEKAHGQMETREYIFTNDIDWLYNKKNWSGIKSIGIAIRTYRNQNNETVQDIRYYISNIDACKIKLISEAIRGEWRIENKIHFFLDTVFDEDNNSCFVENTQKNLNILRKFVLAILKQYKLQTKLSMNSIRFEIAMDFENEITKIIDTMYQQF